MAFKQAFGERSSWLPVSCSQAATFKGDILTRVKSSAFPVCGSADEMRQAFSVMAFMSPTSTHSAAGAEDRSRNLQSPDLVHQTAVGVTFSDAKTALHYSPVWPCTNVKMGEKKAFTKQPATNFNISA